MTNSLHWVNLSLALNVKQVRPFFTSIYTESKLQISLGVSFFEIVVGFFSFLNCQNMKKRKQISNFLERSTPSLLGRQIAAATLRKMTTILIIFCLKFRGHIPFYKVPPPKTPLCFDFRFLVTFCWICIPSMKALYYIFLKSRVMFVSLSTTLVWLCNNQFKKEKSLKNWSWVMNVTHRKKKLKK